MEAGLPAMASPRPDWLTELFASQASQLPQVAVCTLDDNVPQSSRVSTSSNWISNRKLLLGLICAPIERSP